MNDQRSSREARSSLVADARGIGEEYSADAEEIAQTQREVLDEMAQRRRDGNGDGDRAEPSEREQNERPEPDLPAGEPRDALRVDQDLADLQARDERRRHAGAVALEELDQVEMRSHRNDELGPLLEREQ